MGEKGPKSGDSGRNTASDPSQTHANPDSQNSASKSSKSSKSSPQPPKTPAPSFTSLLKAKLKSIIQPKTGLKGLKNLLKLSSGELAPKNGQNSKKPNLRDPRTPARTFLEDRMTQKHEYKSEKKMKEALILQKVKLSNFVVLKKVDFRIIPRDQHPG